MAKKQKTINKRLWGKLTTMAIREYEDGVKFKQPRMLEIQQNEDLYNNKVKRAPKGRFNVPLPVMGGFVDTLMSKIDDAPAIEYEYQNLADYDKAIKTSATWKKESSPATGRWGAKDRATKRTSATAGVGIFELYAESSPDYRSILSVVDPIDFFCDPLGGEHLENHLYCGKDNVFRTESQLAEGVEAGIYDVDQVDRLIASSTNNDQKRVRELFQNRQTRLRQLGLDPNNFSYSGQKVFSLVVIELDFEGKRYLLTFDYDTGIAIRCQRLRDAFGYASEDPELYSFVAWHTHPDELNFWSKAPADDIRPCADAMNTIFNQALDNRQKRNFGQRAVDGTIFPDLEQLEWRPDGLVQGDTKGGERNLREGIFEFTTAEITGTVDMINFMDNFIGTKTGITAAAQGGAGEEKGDQKVGIYYGDLAQVADRLGLYNKSYSDAWSQLGVRFVLGVKNHMTEGYMVRMIGENGITWEEMTREDGTPENDFGVRPVGGQAEIRANDTKKRNRIATLDKIMGNQVLSEKINPTWVIEQYLKAADYEDDDIQTARDMSSDGDIYSLAEASKAIQQIEAGKIPKPYRNATTTFCQRIINYASDKVTDMRLYDKLMVFVQAHIPIALENAKRKKMLDEIAMQAVAAKAGMALGGGKGKPIAPATEEIPADGTPGGTASRSQEITNDIAPQ